MTNISSFFLFLSFFRLRNVMDNVMGGLKRLLINCDARERIAMSEGLAASDIIKEIFAGKTSFDQASSVRPPSVPSLPRCIVEQSFFPPPHSFSFASIMRGILSRMLLSLLLFHYKMCLGIA